VSANDRWPGGVRSDTPSQRTSTQAKRRIIQKKEGSLMKVKPLGDRILVKRVEPQEAKKGGIIIPDSAKEKPMEGKVIAVGQGKTDENGKRIPMEVKAGDRVLIGKYAGTEFKMDDDEHVIVREDEVLGILN